MNTVAETEIAPLEKPAVRPSEEFVDEDDALLDAPWHVILLDDDQHTYEYVIRMLCQIFRYSVWKAMAMAVEVDTRKRVIVATCHREIAEFRQQQIHEFGPDPLIPTCRGSMTAVLERAK